MSNVQNITQNFGRPSYRPETPAGMDPDMRRMAIVAAGLGCVVAVGIGIASLSRHTHHGVPVIEALAGPVRVKPLDPGGMKVAGAEEAVTGVEALAPAAERPAIRALHAKRPAPHPVQTAEARPAAAPAAPADFAPAAFAPAAIAPAAAVQRAAATQALPVPPSVAPRGTSVQLAAFETQQAAEQDWGKLAVKVPGLFDGHRPEVERAQVAGHTVYRLRTGGFTNLAAATAFCGKLRAHGGDCTIAAF